MVSEQDENLTDYLSSGVTALSEDDPILFLVESFAVSLFLEGEQNTN